MAQRRPKDDVELIEQLLKDIVYLKRKRAHNESKTFIVGNVDLVPDLFIPAFRVAVDVDEDTPESKWLIGFHGEVNEGTVTLDWKLNNTSITGADAHVLDTTPDNNSVTLTDPIELEDGDRIRPDIVSSTDGRDMAATAVIVSIPI